jgi:hypothetical protein
MSKSKKHRKPKKKKKVIKELSKGMIPEVEKDLKDVFKLIDEISKVDFWNDSGDKFADELIEKARKVESKIKTKYKDHFDEEEIKSKIPKEYLDNVDPQE